MKIWQDNYVHVQAVMDEFVSLRERTKYLRDEVSRVWVTKCEISVLLPPPEWIIQRYCYKQPNKFLYLLQECGNIGHNQTQVYETIEISSLFSFAERSK